MASPPHWQFLDDAADVLALAGDWLAVDPVLTTVVTTVAHREAAHGVATDAPVPHWWAVLLDGGLDDGLDGGLDGRTVAGVAMRTARFAPYPAYLLPMPDDAARELARLVVDRGEEMGGAGGALPTVRVFADEVARLTGGTVEVDEAHHLFDLPALVPPTRRPRGRLRLAVGTDLELVMDWFGRFHADAAEQGGRIPDPARSHAIEGPDVAARIDRGTVGLWEVDGEPVHLTAWNPPAFGVARIGPVYTPGPHRGRGYATAAVAEASQRILDAGARACLFTDQANPTSNRIYEALGYRRLTDTAQLLIR